MNTKMDKKVNNIRSLILCSLKIRLFQVEKDFAKTYETPDNKIQQLMSTTYNVDKVRI